MLTPEGLVTLRITLRGTDRISLPTHRRPGDKALEVLKPKLNAYVRALYAQQRYSKVSIATTMSALCEKLGTITDSQQYVRAWERVLETDVIAVQLKEQHGYSRAEMPTFEKIARDWCLGTITAAHPKVKRRESWETELNRFETWIFPLIGHIRIDQLRTAHVVQIYNAAASGLRETSRDHLWSLCTRVASLAVWPLELLEAHPIPSVARPKPSDMRQRPQLRPSDDLELMRCPLVDVHDRIYFGFLAREGVREMEGCAVKWTDIDERGLIRCWHTKTKSLDTWLLEPGTFAALKAYRALLGDDAGPLVFERMTVKSQIAGRYRDCLEAAGVRERRPELWEHEEQAGGRTRVVCHSLRALFVTCAIAMGKPDSYIRTRTGHKAERLIKLYTRDADQLLAMNDYELVPLVDAIPELAEYRQKTSEAADRTRARTLTSAVRKRAAASK